MDVFRSAIDEYSLHPKYAPKRLRFKRILLETNEKQVFFIMGITIDVTVRKKRV